MNDHHVFRIQLNGDRIVFFLSLAAGLLILASILGQVGKYVGGYQSMFGFVNTFYVDEEANIPTFFSSSLLLLCSVLLCYIYLYKKYAIDKFRIHWAVLTVLFFLLSLDEAAEIHEMSGKLVSKATGGLHGILYYAWVIPGAFFLIVFTVSFSKFFFHLANQFKVRFAIAGLLFVGGAMGVELLCGSLHETIGEYTLVYSLIATLEEALEIAGTLFFMHSLFRYMAQFIPASTIVMTKQSVVANCPQSDFVVHKEVVSNAHDME